MKRILLTEIPSYLPEKFKDFCKGASLYDSSCSPEAKVLYIEKDGGYYLKSAPLSTLSREAEMTIYFNKKGLAPRVIDYVSLDRDYMITEKAHGEDLTNEKFTSDPKRLARRLAEELRKLHELDFSDCPIKDRSTDYIATVEENFKKGIFDPELTSPIFPFSSREEAYSVFSEYKSLLKRNVLLHGDYCLPNVLFNEDFSFSSFIDVGNGGVGDRHIDVFWGSWTLWFNLKTDKYRDYFIDCYGKDLIDSNMLRAVAAAETFG